MVAQLQPREEGVEKPQAKRPVPRAQPHPKFTKKRSGAPKRSLGFAGWMKWLASCAGLIATIVATIAAIRQLNPPPPPPPPPPPSAAPRIAVDGRAKLARSSKNKQRELQVGLTLRNEGGSMALIPRPTVSLGDALIPPNDLNFTFAEGMKEVIFPVSLLAGASTFEKQIICSIAERRDGEWNQARVLRINLDFRPEGHDPISRCLVAVPPVTDRKHPLSSRAPTCFTITDNCSDFGEYLTNQPLTKRTS